MGDKKWYEDPVGWATGGLSDLTKMGIGAAGSLLGYDAAKDEIDYQKKAAKKSIQWRVADARAAGIHPLYALGAQTHSYNPVGLGDHMSRMGQQVAKYVLTPHEKEMQRLQREREKVEIEVLKSQLPNPGNFNTMNNLPGTGQVPNPNQIDTLKQDPNNPARVTGNSPAVGWMWNEQGYLQRAKSAAAKELTEDDIPGNIEWYWNNKVIPYLQHGGKPPPKSALPSGYDYWKWSPANNGFKPAKFKSKSIKKKEPYNWSNFSGYR